MQYSSCRNVMALYSCVIFSALFSAALLRKPNFYGLGRPDELRLPTEYLSHVLEQSPRLLTPHSDGQHSVRAQH